MGKPSGFLEWQRQAAEYKPRDSRVQNWSEFVEDRPEELSREQGGRCMDCGVPFCTQGCPLGNPIPEFNDFVYRGRWKEAWEVLSRTNNFPEFTGRLCPAPCESACVLSINEKPVTIEQNEREIVERAFSEGWIQTRRVLRRTGKTAAIIGSGPAGLAAADQLNQAGHTVTVYERDEQPGGLLRYGIPDFKLDKQVIDRRLTLMEAEGVTFQCGIAVGADLSYETLLQEYDAVVLCTGAGRPRDLNVPGRELDGVHFAMEFLGLQNRRVRDDKANEETGLHARDRHVVILGGGDTGSDCLGTSIRQGAASVTQIELMPAPPTDREDENPWPQWPMVFRTSSSQAEGGQREFAAMTTKVVGDQGFVHEIELTDVELVEKDGRPSIVPIAGSERRLRCDMLILAMGFVGPDLSACCEQTGLELNARGLPAVTPGAPFETNVPGLYFAGDSGRGASLIVWAISDGREAARIVDAKLMGIDARLPTRGQNLPFGGR
jgi:glutamate synthase (NADPH/NADH) small chain